MQIETHRRYDKMWAKLHRKQQVQTLTALKLFVSDQHNEKLRVHQLKGKYYPQYSISAGGGLRVHFLKTDKKIVLMMVGAHAQLY